MPVTRESAVGLGCDSHSRGPRGSGALPPLQWRLPAPAVQRPPFRRARSVRPERVVTARLLPQMRGLDASRAAAQLRSPAQASTKAVKRSSLRSQRDQSLCVPYLTVNEPELVAVP